MDAHVNAEAHVWVVDVDGLAAEELARCGALPSIEERARMKRFRFAPDRDAYAAAHALARLALSWCDGGVAPRGWTFETAAHGRPEVAMPTRLRFNLSHTRGVVQNWAHVLAKSAAHSGRGVVPTRRRTGSFSPEDGMAPGRPSRHVTFRSPLPSHAAIQEE